MKTAIATLLSVLAVASVSTAAGAQKLRTSLITNTQLSQIDFKIVNDAIAPIYTPVASIEDTGKDNDGNNDNEVGTFGFTPVLAAPDTTFSTLSGSSIGLAQDQTAGVNTGVTFNKDNSNQNNNDNQPSEGSNIGIVVKSYEGITIQPYEPNWTGSIAVKPDNSYNDIPRIKEPNPAPICQGFAVDNVEAVEGEDEYSSQMVTGCAGTLITNLYFSDGTATRMEDYGTLASAQYKLEDQPWQEFVPSSPFRIPDEGYFMVRTNIVSDDETDDGEAFKLTVRSQSNQVAIGMVTMVDPLESPVEALAEAPVEDAMDWSDMGEIIASLDLDDLSPKQALEVLYALQAIENDNRN
jgi:hypothetical protein